MFHPDQEPLSSLEERLRSWVPASGGLDCDRMLFEAGQAQGRASNQARTATPLWKWMTAASLLLASGLGMAWHHERSQRRALELNLVKLAEPPAVVSSPVLIAERQGIAERHGNEPAVDPTSYLALVRQVDRLEDAADIEPDHAAPRVRPADQPRPAPLRPRDWDRVISL